MFKKIILLFVIIFVLGTTQAFAYDVQHRPFSDVKKDDWSEEYIYTLSALRIIDGYPDNTFKPGLDISREAFMKLLIASTKLEPFGTGDSFSIKDVQKDRWSYPFVATAYDHQLIDFMVVQDSFMPAQAMTREEVSAIIGKYLLNQFVENERQQWIQQDWKREEQSRAFLDQAQIKLNTENKPYLYYAAHLNIMTGDAKGTFRPQDSISRREAAAVIHRLIEEQNKAVDLDITGFYALRSYQNVDQMQAVDDVILGWSNLVYSSQGSAFVNINSTEYSVPSGYREVIGIAKENQVSKNLMVFYDKPNLKDFLRDEPAQEAFITSLMEVVDDESFGFSGVSIDFEGLREEASQHDLVDFLQTLKSQLGNKELSVSVPPTYYYKGYDLQGIGNVADRVILMAYEFTDPSSRLPSAPLSLVHDVVADAAKQIPSEKLVLGVLKIANQWVTAADSTKTDYYEPEIQLVEDRLKQNDIETTLAVPYLMNQITFTDDRGDHFIYYEDTESIELKIRLAQYYNLKGVAFWHMGNFTNADWELLEKY